MARFKYDIGDKVEVINYGHKLFNNTGKGYEVIELAPELVGKKAIVAERSMTQEIPQYSLAFGNNTISWFYEDQMRKDE